MVEKWLSKMNFKLANFMLKWVKIHYIGFDPLLEGVATFKLS